MAASAIRKRGYTLTEFETTLDTSTQSFQLLGSTIDQSPLVQTILRISAMLSASVIPVALFDGTTHAGEAPSRFSNMVAEIKCAYVKHSWSFSANCQ